jgi:hypothetical protein
MSIINQRQHLIVGNKKFQKREDLQSMLSIITLNYQSRQNRFFYRIMALMKQLILGFFHS